MYALPTIDLKPVYLYMKVIEWQLQVQPKKKKKKRGEKNNLIPSET